MAMTTYLQLVDAKELAELRSAPETINRLDKKGELSFFTQLPSTLSFFAFGDAYPDDEQGAVFNGLDTVECDTLENGSFGLIEPGDVGSVLAVLKEVDAKQLYDRVVEADLDDLASDDEAELEEIELVGLNAEDDPAGVLVKELSSVVAFYERAAQKKLGVVMYTT